MSAIKTKSKKIFTWKLLALCPDSKFCHLPIVMGVENNYPHNLIFIMQLQRPKLYSLIHFLIHFKLFTYKQFLKKWTLQKNSVFRHKSYFNQKRHFYVPLYLWQKYLSTSWNLSLFELGSHFFKYRCEVFGSAPKKTWITTILIAQHSIWQYWQRCQSITCDPLLEA